MWQARSWGNGQVDRKHLGEYVSFMDRMATAPISWGICEVPGWGVQLPVERVLAEMADLGFPSTELGSEGYLPSEPDELRSVLELHGLDLLAAFVPAIVHDPAEANETIRRMTEMAELLQAVGATYFNTSPVTTWDLSLIHISEPTRPY